jgi:hypothetical protein
VDHLLKIEALHVASDMKINQLCFKSWQVKFKRRRGIHFFFGSFSLMHELIFLHFYPSNTHISIPHIWCCMFGILHEIEPLNIKLFCFVVFLNFSHKIIVMNDCRNILDNSGNRSDGVMLLVFVKGWSFPYTNLH